MQHTLIDECLLLEETTDNHDFRQAKARRLTLEKPAACIYILQVLTALHCSRHPHQLVM